jgi:hypothetical protein
LSFWTRVARKSVCSCPRCVEFAEGHRRRAWQLTGPVTTCHRLRRGEGSIWGFAFVLEETREAYLFPRECVHILLLASHLPLFPEAFAAFVAR